MTGKTLLTSDEKSLIVGSYRLIVPIWETVADLFYNRLFEERPQYRELFPEDMTEQKRKMMSMLAFIAKSLDWTEEEWREDVAPQEDLFLVALALGRRHHMLHKIPDDAYKPVGLALLWALDRGLGRAFTPDLRRAWSKLCGALVTSAQMGARASNLQTEFGLRS